MAWCGLAAVLGLALLAGCSTVGGGAAGRAPPGAGADGPPLGTAPDPMQVPDAQPRVEPIRQGGPNKPYEVLGQRYVPETGDVPVVERGLASWYGRKFHGHRTASGEVYNMNAMTAAHKTMPIPSYARVRNPANGREVIVRINDRGPFASNRIIDLSWAAAVRLGLQKGVAEVEVQRITNDEIRAGLDPVRHEARAAAPSPDLGAVAVAAPAVASVPPVAGVASTAPVVAGPAVEPVPLPAVVPANRPPEAVAEADPQRAFTAAAAGFWVQLGAFAKKEGALGFQQRVARDLDWLAPLLTVFSEGGLNRVQAGPFASREQARSMAERLRSDLRLVPVLVQRR